jgi:hypothetical protein
MANDEHRESSGVVGATRPRRGSASDGTSRSAAEQDLKATEDAIRADVDQLSEIEGRKEDLAPDDPRVDELSDGAVSIADRLSRETRAERQLTDELR